MAPPLSQSGGQGLTSAEARARLAQYGPNAVVEEKTHPLRQFIRRFWDPVPWLLEAAIILQLFLKEYLEAAVIGALLLLNALLGFFQEARAQKALVLLRQQLRVQARVCRDGRWTTLPAEDVVPGDQIHVRQGGIVPADMKVGQGSVLVDQSALTGESAAVPVKAGGTAYAGTILRAGEATGEVTATGARTFFGKTAELVRTAGSVNREEKEIVAVVRNLFAANAATVVIVTACALERGMTMAYVLPLLLTILLASIPVALPATFTLAAALGSVELVHRRILITRLSALHDLASMTVLCTDKTGTLTRNQAAVESRFPAQGFSEKELLRAAAFASDPSGLDPVDGAIVKTASETGWRDGELERTGFKPFDPATKQAEGLYRDENGAVRRFLKGAPAVIAGFTGVAAGQWQAQEESIAGRGQRALGVAAGDGAGLRFAGMVGIEDAVRDDSKSIVAEIGQAGVRVVMITGDNALTAQSVATQVGIPPRVCPPEQLRGELEGETLEYSVFAGVFPEDKFRLVRAFQRLGDVVGMSGDGVNDAPALRQAEAGVAVANATDVARASAAIVLTEPGLGGLVPAIATSRRVFQRIIAYTLNMLIKKMEMMALLVIGFLLTSHRPLTPMLMVMILFLNDFLTMSLSTDRMSFSSRPNHWNTKGIILATTALAACKLLFSLGTFLAAYFMLHMEMRPLQTLTFFTLILSSQAGVYLMRERGHFWDSPPSRLLVMSSIVGLGLAFAIAARGILMFPVDPRLLLVIAGAGVIYFASVDWVKVRLFNRLNLR